MVREIVYQGNAHMSPEDLDTLTGLHKDVPLNPVANQQACLAILNKYHETGRLAASVDLVEGGKIGDTRVVFNIAEGPKAKVKDISFTGVNFVSSAGCARQVHSSAAFLGIGGTYIADGDGRGRAGAGKVLPRFWLPRRARQPRTGVGCRPALRPPDLPRRRGTALSVSQCGRRPVGDHET